MHGRERRQDGTMSLARTATGTALAIGTVAGLLAAVTLLDPDRRNVADSAARIDIDCDPEALGADADFRIETARHAVDGALGTTCLGRADPRLESAWETLLAVAGPEALAPIGVLTRHAQPADAEELTMAWVSAHDEAGTVFQLSFDPDSVEGYPAEAALTLVHELAHVLSAAPGEVRRDPAALEACATWSNGLECFVEGSLVHRWIEAFWGDGRADAVEVRDGPGVADGRARCDADDGFFGPYAATTPEEDFAQSFAAWTLGLEPSSAGQAERLAWMETEPEFAGYRERAHAAGIAPLRNPFEPCGPDL